MEEEGRKTFFGKKGCPPPPSPPSYNLPSPPPAHEVYLFFASLKGQTDRGNEQHMPKAKKREPRNFFPSLPWGVKTSATLWEEEVRLFY